MRPSRIHWVMIAIAVAAVAIGAAVFHMMMTPPDDLDLTRSKPTEQKAYVASIAPEREPLRQGELHAWVLTVTTPDNKPVEDAAIAVDGGMPQHGHGLPTSPRMTSYLGEGRYRIEGVKFNMGGWWELKFSISAPPGDDRVTFNLKL